MLEKRHTGIIYLLFFFSGVTGLVYEVLWTRMFVLVFGATTFAISTVLTVFMAGLALGSFYFGRLIDKRGNPLKLYAFLQISIGIYALLLPLLLSLLNSVYAGIHQHLSLSFLTMSIIRFVLSFLALIIPTTLMGGTLPVLSKYIITKREKLGLSVGNLYSINTIGGAVGCFAAGFILILLVGVRNTIYLASGVNVAIGAAALMLKSRGDEDGQPDATEEPPAEQEDKVQSLKIRLITLAFGLSGFAALAYEVLWTRVLSMILGTTVYAFSIMLTAFLCGIALGSFIFARFVDRDRHLVLIFGVFQMIIGCFGILSIFIFGSLPLFLLKMFAKFGGSWRNFTFMQFVIAFLIMLIPTSLMGATFPLVSRICARRMNHLGRQIGSIYSVNTLGAILGSLAAGFLLIPLVGLQESIMLIASINVLIGLGALIGSDLFLKKLGTFWRPMAAVGIISALILALVTIPAWDRKILAGGVYFDPLMYLNSSQKIDLDARVGESQMLYYADGIGSTVAVFGRGPELSLKINGKPVASTTPTDLRLLGMMGHLPMILHNAPKSALVIGLGAGVTAGMVSQYESVRRLDCVELERKVVEAARLFALENRDVMANKKLNLIIGDGRNFLQGTTRKYDVITSDPIHPWVSGAGSLYSAEHFQLCKSRLNAGGIIAQWLPLYEMPEKDFKMVIRTFQSVFPHTTLWLAHGDAILIGMEDELRINYRTLMRKLSDENIERDMRMLYIDSTFDFLTCLKMGENELAEYAADAELNTDDHPILEFSAPKALHAETVADNLEAIRQNMKPVLPHLYNLGSKEEASRIKKKLLEYFGQENNILKERISAFRGG